MILRPYQSATLDSLWQWFEKHPAGNPVVDACVGAGKSVLIAELCRYCLTTWPGTRIVMVVASKELAEQNLAKLLAVWPDAPVSVHSAAMRRKELGGDILYATIGSIYKKAHLLGRVDLLLVDECHAIPHGEEGMYRQFIGALTHLNRSLRVIGWTGTPFRGDGVWLHAGENALFNGIAARVKMADLLDMGYLSPLTPATTATRLVAEGVGTRGGDYIVGQLAKAIDRDDLVESACEEICAIGHDRKRWLVFGVTVEHAGHIADSLDRRGIACAVVTADTPRAEREASIVGFRAGRIRALVNVAVLTTGFDVPEVDLIALMRNTKSPVLYVQIAGRGMRIAEGKKDCLWLDFTDTTERMGPVDAITGRAPKERGDAPIKMCPECAEICPAGAAQCPNCGHEFPPPERVTGPHGATVSGAAILSSQVEQRIFDYPVTRVAYAAHAKPGKPDSLRVDYWSGLRMVASQWVCLSHSGYAREKACHWWRARNPASYTAVPGDTDQGLEWIESGFELLRPTTVTVNETGKYPEIIKMEFSHDANRTGRPDQLLPA